MAKSKAVARYTDEHLEEEAGLGPAMKALNKRQRAFVYAMFESGAEKMENSNLARMAGYEGNDAYLAVQGHRVANHPKVQAAIREMAETRNAAILPWLQRRLEEIAGSSTHKDQLSAIKHAQALGGVTPKTVHVVEHRTDRAGLIAEIGGALQLLSQLGVKVTNLMPGVDVIEGTAVEVVSSDEGLEDIL